MHRPRRGPKRATRADVAKAANVSTAAVSVAFAGSYATASVSDATRKRILQAAERLGYQPNPMAHSLQSNRSMLIAFSCRESTAFALWRILAGLQNALGNTDYATLCYTYGDELADERRHLERIWSRRADGLVLIPNMHYDSTNEKEIHELADKGVPIVQLPHQIIPRIPSVSIDFATCGRMAAQHVQALGHRRIAMVVPSSLNPTPSPGNRHQHEFIRGYTEQMHEAGLDPIMITTRPVHGWTSRRLISENAVDIARSIVEHPDQPTAAISLWMFLLVAAANGMTRLGLKVPDHLSLLTYDGTGIADLSEPPLTTVNIEDATLGRAAGQMLLQLIDGKSIENQSFQPELIERGSTGPPRAD